MSVLDYCALVVFITLWWAFNWLTDGKRNFKRMSLTRGMAIHRERWIRNSLTRDLKMIDTQIIAGLQNGTAFFASTAIFALGGCFALLGATEQVQAIFSDLPNVFHGGRTAYELKVGGLAAIFGYSYFKFGWAYRLFNYCSILFGAIPMTGDAHRDEIATKMAADRVIDINIIAAKNFNAGLRATFLSIGYLGWFINAWVFMAVTAFVILILLRRQFFSDARDVIIRDLEPTK